MNEISSEHRTDDNGKPAGGTTTAPGVTIEWQNGPLATWVQPGEGLCPCGAAATWTYDPETMAPSPVPDVTEFCELHGPNSLPRLERTGAFVEDVIAAALDRIEHYQTSEFRCRENALAITKLEEALHWLAHRTADRERRGVEGTHAT